MPGYIHQTWNHESSRPPERMEGCEDSTPHTSLLGVSPVPLESHTWEDEQGHLYPSHFFSLDIVPKGNSMGLKV